MFDVPECAAARWAAVLHPDAMRAGMAALGKQTDLRNSGALTQQEFETMKAKLIGST